MNPTEQPDRHYMANQPTLVQQLGAAAEGVTLVELTGSRVLSVHLWADKPAPEILVDQPSDYLRLLLANGTYKGQQHTMVGRALVGGCTVMWIDRGAAPAPAPSPALPDKAAP